MNRKLLPLSIVFAFVAACSGSDGAQGPAGPAGEVGPPGTGTPSISEVTPVKVFLARKQTISIAGSGTTWTSDAKADFGPGVTVDKVEVASPTAIVANITIAKDAATGPRDVKVTDGQSTTTFAGAFDVESPIEFVATQGTVAQGSVSIVTVKNDDFENPFDATVDANGAATNLTVAVPGLTMFAQSPTINSFDAILAVDVTAAPADVLFDLESGPPATPAAQTEFPLPKAFTIAARTATAFTATGASGTEAKAFDSSLFTFSGAAKVQLQDITVEASGAGATADPFAFLIPKSGKFADRLALNPAPGFPSTMITKNADPVYVLFWDDAGGSGYTYSIKLTSTDATAVQKTATNDNDQSKADVVSGFPAAIAPITITDSDLFYFKVTIPAAGAGKTLRAAIYGAAPDSDPQTAIDVDILDNTGTSVLQFPDIDVSTDPTVTTLTTGDVYFVTFAPQAGSIFGGGFDPAHNKFEAFIRFE